MKIIFSRKKIAVFYTILFLFTLFIPIMLLMYTFSFLPGMDEILTIDNNIWWQKMIGIFMTFLMLLGVIMCFCIILNLQTTNSRQKYVKHMQLSGFLALSPSLIIFIFMVVFWQLDKKRNIVVQAFEQSQLPISNAQLHAKNTTGFNLGISTICLFMWLLSWAFYAFFQALKSESEGWGLIFLISWSIIFPTSLLIGSILGFLIVLNNEKIKSDKFGFILICLMGVIVFSYAAPFFVFNYLHYKISKYNLENKNQLDEKNIVTKELLKNTAT